MLVRSRRAVLSLALLGSAAVAASARQAAPPAAPPHASPHLVFVKCGRLIDGEGGALLANALITIEDDRIKSVGADARIEFPVGAEVIDLSSMTVLPGLIDCHTHLSMQLGGNYWKDLATKSAIDHAILAPKFAQTTLEAGFTTVRDVGSGGYVDVALREAIDRGDV